MVQAVTAGKTRARVATKNISFTRELLVASNGGNDVHKASQGWVLAHFGVNNGPDMHCQLCHAYIVNFAVIKRAENAMQLTIGHDCLEKLGNLQRTGRVESLSVTLPTWKSYRSVVRAFIKTELKGKRDIVSSVTKWLAAQTDLPENIRETLEWLEKFGVPESEEKARELVAYYKANRKFPVEQLVDHSVLFGHSFHHDVGALPDEVTLDELPQLLEKIERSKVLARQQREARWAEEARVRAELETKAIAERKATFKERIKELIKKGTILESQLELGKNPKTGASEWKLRHKGRLCLLGYHEAYQASEGAVLFVPHEIIGKRITILFRAYEIEEHGYPMLAYRGMTGAKCTLY